MEVVLIGKGLLEITTIITKITGSVKSISNLIDSVSNKNQNMCSEFCEFIDIHDIRNKLDTYSLLINEFPGTKSQSVKNSLISVKNVIIEIETQLRSIKYKIDYNKSIWILSKIRSYSISQDLKLLEKLVKKLDSRIESLKTVTEISKLWNNRLFISNPLEYTAYNSKYPLNKININANGTLDNKKLDLSIDDSVIDLTSYIIINE